ncbi:MAG: hypothetical protein ABJX32_04335 [Tateyamaria sp.]|uniref:hypothetical protein n=1 Tax=Tateyamaria sp. TaxID=1929288 RepID=UPI00329DDDD6
MAQDVVIFGGKGGGATVADYMLASGSSNRVLGFLNDVAPKGTLISGLEVLGAFADWRDFPEHVTFNAPLHLVKEMQARSAIIASLNIPEHRWARAAHPSAVLSQSARIGSGCSIGPFCDICNGAALGSHIAIRAGVSVAHDATIDDFAFLGARSTILGYVQIRKGAHIGPGAVIKERVTVGEFAVVGIGSTVLSDVKPYSIVAGSPARELGKVKQYER